MFFSSGCSDLGEEQDGICSVHIDRKYLLA
jgi:hypothetical protein